MLGSRIREKRKELDITLRELATRTDLTPSFLSQVERDLAVPSITSLRKIAEVLSVPIFHFLIDSDGASPVVRKGSRKKLVLPDSHLVYELLSPDLKRKMEVWVAQLEPGAAGSDQPMSHPAEECILVLHGKLGIKLGKEEYVLEEGDSIYFDGAIPHLLSSVGEEDLVFVSSVSPPVF
jgi:transcriptional regulator with XRE-family HTH domain